MLDSLGRLEDTAGCSRRQANAAGVSVPSKQVALKKGCHCTYASLVIEHRYTVALTSKYFQVIRYTSLVQKIVKYPAEPGRCCSIAVAHLSQNWRTRRRHVIYGRRFLRKLHTAQEFVGDLPSLVSQSGISEIEHRIIEHRGLNSA